MKNKVKRKGVTSIQIRPQIAVMLAHYVQKGRSKSEVINEALRQYLIEKELQEIKEQLIPIAQAKGIYTYEDVEKALGK